MPSNLYPASPSTLARVSRNIYVLLVAFPTAYFTLALGTDIIYWQTSYLMWLEFSAWLLLAGMVTGVAALPFGAIEFFRDRELRTKGSAWAHAIGRIVVLILAFFNNLVHSADGWTAIMPWGLTLSALTVLVMLVMAWLGAAWVHTPGFRGRYHV
jgi:uncharacterized membrane protein